jgi:hypothetical protein
MACQFRRRYEDLEWYGVQTDTSKDRSLVHHISRVSKTQLVSPMKPSIRGDETVTSQATEEATAQSRQSSKEQGTRNKEQGTMGLASNTSKTLRKQREGHHHCYRTIFVCCHSRAKISVYGKLDDDQVPRMK